MLSRMGGGLGMGRMSQPGGLVMSAYAAFLLADDFDNSKYWQTDDNTGASGTIYSDPQDTGAERLDNGDFSDGSTNWVIDNTDATHTITIANGEAHFVLPTTTPITELQYSGAYVVGQTYEITVVVSEWTSGAIKADSAGITSGSIGSVGTHTFRGTAAGTALLLYRASAPVDMKVTSVSVKPLHSTFTASGSCYELNSDGTIAGPFAANVPAITDEGYKARQAFTNLFLHNGMVGGSPPTGWSAFLSDGTSTFADCVFGSLAQSFQAEVAAGRHVIKSPLLTFAASTTYTIYIYVEEATGTLGGNSGAYLETQSFVASGTPSYQAVAGHSGWKSFTFTTDGTGGSSSIRLGVGVTGATDGLLRVCLPHMFTGSALTDFPIIITTSAAATRGEALLTHNLFADGSALTDQDMLIWAKGTPEDFSAFGVMLHLSDGTLGNRIEMGFNAGGQYRWTITSASTTVVDQYSGSHVAVVDDEVTLLVRRSGGNWRCGYYKAATLTWFTTDVAGAMASTITKGCAGSRPTGGTSPLRGTIDSAYIQTGTFSTDQEVIDAITGAP